MRIFRVAPAAFVLLLMTSLDMTETKAGTIQLTGATASHTLGPDFVVSNAIDNDIKSGWSPGGFHSDVVGVFQTVDPAHVGLPFSLFAFTIDCNSPYANHVLDNFRLSVTTDAAPEYGSGATWTVLDPSSMEVFAIVADVVQPLSTTMWLTEAPNHVMSIGGTNHRFARYVIETPNSLAGITGFRIEAGVDGTLTGTGPGGNFVLSNLGIQQIPEPATFVLLALGGLGMLAGRWCKRREK